MGLSSFGVAGLSMGGDSEVDNELPNGGFCLCDAGLWKRKKGNAIFSLPPFLVMVV